MKKAPIFLIIAVLISAIFLSSCEVKENEKARSVGSTSEILVVTQNQDQWKGLQGKTVREFFGQLQYGLPQPEPMYKVANILISGFSDMFKKHRNIFIVEINSKLKEATVEVSADLWAKPQYVIRITAPDKNSWVETFEKRKEEFMILYNRSERERLMNIFRPTANMKIMNEMTNTLGIKMIIPDGYYIAKKENNFMWIRKELKDISQCFIIYTMPYRDTLDLSPNRIIMVRDSVVRTHIPGPVDGSFMSTEKEFTPPMVTNTANFISDFAVENRGMWNVVGDFMAGPYVAYTVVDEENGRLITVEGYVYAPNKDKRNLLSQLEALLYSLEIVNQSQSDVQ